MRYSDDSSSLSSAESRGFRRREEVLYMTRSFQQVNQSILSCCLGHDKAPMMMRQEKAFQRQQNRNSRMRTASRITYGYIGVCLILAIQALGPWRKKYSFHLISDDDAAVPSTNTHSQSTNNFLSLFRTSSGTDSIRIRKPTEFISTRIASEEEFSLSSNNAGGTTQEENLSSEKNNYHGDEEEEDPLRLPPIPQEIPDKPESPADFNDDFINGNNNNIDSPDHNPRSTPAGIRRFPFQADIYFDAFDSQGNKNYVADPTAFRRARQAFVDSALESGSTERQAFWATLNAFQSTVRQGTRSSHIPVSQASICTPGKGRGMEDEGGYKIFAEKLRVAEPMMDNDSSKLLCAVYSHASMYDLARTAALTWGYKCDGFLVFGDAPSIPDLGFVQLDHTGEESYENMWQKVRAIWAYIHHNYRDEYQYFHLGGDDMYLIPENLKYRLAQKGNDLTDSETPMFMGQQVPLGASKQSYVAGGPGYTLNQSALHRLVREALPKCFVDKVAPYEDRLISACLNNIGVRPTDSRDPATGEQTYHGVAPHTLYTTRAKEGSKRQSFHSNAAAYWAKQEHPLDSAKKVGPKEGLDSVARYSVSFHNLFHPVFMARVHSLLHIELCEASSTPTIEAARDEDIMNQR